jgi:SET domain-containing protein
MLVLPTSDWLIKKTKHKGRGVFARTIIEPGTVVADYLGKILTHSQAENRPELMGVVRSEKEVIWPADIRAPGAHCVNHSCAANCGYYPYHGHVLIVALRRIFPGEEFGVDYMMDAPTDYDPAPYYPVLLRQQILPQHHVYHAGSCPPIYL